MKMYHRNTEWANAVGEWSSTELLNTRLPQNFNLLKKYVYLWSEAKDNKTRYACTLSTARTCNHIFCFKYHSQWREQWLLIDVAPSRTRSWKIQELGTFNGARKIKGVCKMMGAFPRTWKNLIINNKIMVVLDYIPKPK